MQRSDPGTHTRQSLYVENVTRVPQEGCFAAMLALRRPARVFLEWLDCGMNWVMNVAASTGPFVYNCVAAGHASCSQSGVAGATEVSKYAVSVDAATGRSTRIRASAACGLSGPATRFRHGPGKVQALPCPVWGAPAPTDRCNTKARQPTHCPHRGLPQQRVRVASRGSCARARCCRMLHSLCCSCSLRVLQTVAYSTRLEYSSTLSTVEPY